MIIKQGQKLLIRMKVMVINRSESKKVAKPRRNVIIHILFDEIRKNIFKSVFFR